MENVSDNGGIMNLANKLTLLRVMLAPFFVMFMLTEQFIPHSFLWAALLFAGAGVTDIFDGKIARKNNMVTDLGKFLDPLADKILVISALICFVQLGWCPAWAAALITAREFAVSGIRLIAAGSADKTVIAASVWGKLKTVSTMTAILMILTLHILADFSVINAGSFPIQPVSDALIYICVILTVVSGGKYIWDYRDLLKNG